MEWYRIRQSTTKHQLAMARINMPAMINARMEHSAKQNGADPTRDRFVFMKRDDDWYVEFGLDVNPPDCAVKKLRSRGWEIS